MPETAVHDLPRESYPVTIRAFRTDNFREVWGITLLAPPRGQRHQLWVPPLAKQEDAPITMYFKYGDGRNHWWTAPSDEEP